MAHCFVTRQLPGAALRRLSEAHDVEVWPDRLPPSYQELRSRATQTDGLLTLLTDRIDAALIDSSPSLKAISNYAVGYDNIDLRAATAHGIAVGNTPDVLTEATADLAFALLLAAARKLPEAIDAVKAGDWLTWEPGRYLGAEVHGATLGIVGLGRIGRAVARRARGFEMNVIHTGTSARPGAATGTSAGRIARAGAGASTRPGAATGTSARRIARPGARAGAGASTRTGTGADTRASRRAGTGETLLTLLRQSDFVSLHCPLTPETHHLIDSEALSQMRSTAILVNTARGPIVDPSALLKALIDGSIAGAALDVTDPEPLPADDPLIGAPNLIVAPHIGSATRAARERMGDLAVENLLAGLEGRPMPHQVNEVG